MDDMHKLRSLAGLSTDGISEAKAPKMEIDNAVFDKSPKALVKELLKMCSLEDAIKKLKAFMKTADESAAEKLQKAMDMLKSQLQMEQMQLTRRAAGLPLLEKVKPEEDEDDEPEAEKDEKPEDEDDLPSIVKKMAANLLKNGVPSEDKLAELLLKVYAAGKSDAEKEEAKEPEAKKETSEEE